MKLIVGLGNPGSKYETTRHNAGFLVLDLIADEIRSSWEDSSKKFQGQTCRGQLFGDSCILLKPDTFMNLSGRSVARVANFYKIAPSEIVVLHDDIDVPAGKVKARVGGGPGGHKGISSIIECIGSRDFHRIKLGVGRPEGEEHTPGVSSWVLGRLSDSDLLALQKEMFDEVMIRVKGIFSNRGGSK